MIVKLSKLFAQKPKKICFIYSPEYKFSGSTVMRGQQLSEITRSAFRESRIVEYRSLAHEPRGAILFMTKGAVSSCTVELLRLLKYKRNKLVFDPVDGDLPDEKAALADVIVAASKEAFDKYTTQFPKTRVELVDHHVDLRIKPAQPVDTFRAGYFGELVNTVITHKIEAMVNFVLVDTSRQDTTWLNEIPEYNFHYAIRSTRSIDRHKPFLKGFTAAHCSANVLIQSSQVEAVRWLGEDYPYILRGDVTEESILKMLKKAKKEFGTDTWFYGLETMQKIKKETSKEAIGSQMKDLIASLD